MHDASPTAGTVGRPAPGPLLAFVAFGLFAGCWAALFPVIRANSGVSEATMGLAFLASGVGATPAMIFAGPALDRFGERVVGISLLALAAASFTMAYVGSAWLLFGSFLLVGLTAGATDIAMNGAVAHEEAGTRPLMNLAHALFSVGAAIGGGLTGLARGAGWDEPAIMGAMAAVLLLVAATNRRGPWPSLDGRDADSGSVRPLVSKFLVLVGLLVALCFIVEATAFTWTASHVEDTFGASPRTAGLAVALYFAGSVAGRVIAHLWGARMPARAVVVGSGVLIAVAASCVALSPTVVLVVVALFALGVGTAAVAPTLYSIAGASAAGRRGAALATVAMLGYAGNLMGPAIAGFAADAASLRASFAMMAAIGVVLALGAMVVLRGVGMVEPDEEPGVAPDNLHPFGSTGH